MTDDKTKIEPEIEAVHLRARVAELEQICAAQRDELAGLRARDFSALSERELRVLDMWPRFEGGVPVMYEDAFRLGGETHTAYGFNFGTGGRVSISAEQGSHVRLPNGERVKRPAPEVLDADGVPIKIGDTVYNPLGIKLTVKSFNDRYVVSEEYDNDGYIPSALTHRAPDSWEKLFGEASVGACCYFGRLNKDGTERCEGCPAEQADCCTSKQMEDLVRRAKKLAGIEAE